ncbi:MAG: aromatic ring-hydroxylating dioxygenase subunit alpha [Polyangiaceae bacterium]
MEAAVNAESLEGKVSVVRLLDAWYPICESGELEERPLTRKLYGRPLVVFRNEAGSAGALLDRCPHRNVPLSLGQVVGPNLQCGYHGWQFDREGVCRKIPGLCGPAELQSRNVESHPVREQDGYVWVWANHESEPTGAPFPLPKLDAPGYTTVRRMVEAKGTLHATIENALDVPHTSFAHKGLFRGAGRRNRIKAVVTRGEDRVQAEYVGEPRPEGVVGRVLSPSGGVVTHYDRFILPSVAQVEYSIGAENHILVTAIGTPVDDFVTRLYAVVTFRTRFPSAVVKRVLDPIAMRIFAQDAAILETQTDAIVAFGGESFVSTEIDLMGPQILRLMRRAEQKKPAKDGDESWRLEVELEV